MSPPIFVLLFLVAIPSTFRQSRVNSASISRAYDDLFRSARTGPSDPYGSSCTVSTASCTSLYKCRELNELVEKIPNEEEKQILLNHYCGKTDGVPYVCCDDYSGRHLRNTSQTSRKCGVNKFTKNAITNYITGKTKPAELGAWPWMVALYTRLRKNGSPEVSCGGSLISEEWVLTAAHCVPTTYSGRELAYVVLGDLDLDEEVEDNADPIKKNLAEVIKHPNYEENTSLNDIALLRLSEPVEYNTHIHLICLHKGERYLDDEKFYHSIRQASVIGWGAIGEGEVESSHLLQTEVRMVDITQCKKEYATSRTTKIDQRTLCAGTGENDTCTGDSGGPLMFKDFPTNTWSLAGIVSRGKGCGNKNYPGIYTRVAAFIDWIEEKTNLKF